MVGWYDTAQICVNGHLINSSIKSDPQDCQDFCSRCGSKTITTCQQCDKPIRGRVHYDNVVDFGDIEIPAFCIHCGTPYIWTRMRLDAARELAYEIESLSEDDQRILANNLDDLVRDGPKTQVAAMRFKKIVAKTSKEIAAGFREILVDVVSEAARKAIWPQ